MYYCIFSCAVSSLILDWIKLFTGANKQICMGNAEYIVMQMWLNERWCNGLYENKIQKNFFSQKLKML